MASIVITSFFTRGGNPATDIEIVSGGTYPVVRIWEIIDGTPLGDAFINEFIMIPVEDGANDDGFYKYEFTDIPDGYDPNKVYVYRVDGGPSITVSNRYQIGRLDPSDNIAADISDLAQNLYLDTDSVLNLLKFVTKMEAGRTRIDPVAKTLTVYDEDCTTVLRVFNLYDSTGIPSVTEVCERRPVTKGPGDTTTITDVCP